MFVKTLFLHTLAIYIYIISANSNEMFLLLLLLKLQMQIIFKSKWNKILLDIFCMGVCI